MNIVLSNDFYIKDDALNIILVEKREKPAADIERYFRTVDDAVDRFVDITTKKELKGFAGGAKEAARKISDLQKAWKAECKLFAQAQKGAVKC